MANLPMDLPRLEDLTHTPLWSKNPDWLAFHLSRIAGPKLKQDPAREIA